MSDQSGSGDNSDNNSGSSQGGEKKWWAKALFVGGIVGPLLVPIAALGHKAGIWGLGVAFGVLGTGTVIATIVFFLGIVAFFICLNRKLVAERPVIAVGVVASAIVLAIMGMQFSTATSVPTIHNISTDIERPPQFDKIVALRGEGSNPLEYDAATLGDAQRQAYPFVKPLITQTPPTDMMVRAVEVLESMGLEIVDTNASAGRIEATASTFWFGFKDDVVVRIRPEGGGSVIDVRSVSRVGQSDLGANARRIGEILNGLGGS